MASMGSRDSSARLSGAALLRMSLAQAIQEDAGVSDTQDKKEKRLASERI